MRRLDEVQGREAAGRPLRLRRARGARSRTSDATTPIAVAHELVELAHDLVRAVQEHDVDRLEQLLATEFTLQGAAGQLDRDAFLEAAAGPYEIDEFAYEEIDPRCTATRPCSSRATGRSARLDGRDLSTACTSPTSGCGATARWQIVRRHATIAD